MYHTDQKAALEAAERLRQKVESHEVKDDNENVLHVTISVGVATFPNENIHDAKELIEFADQALYKAKENGRNRVEAYKG
jgi:diguanylate cyclase